MIMKIMMIIMIMMIMLIMIMMIGASFIEVPTPKPNFLVKSWTSHFVMVIMTKVMNW